ncbi:MAG: AraC family transcriptional regulator [Pseudomonadota bacterium]
MKIGFVVAPRMLATGTVLPLEMWRAAGDAIQASTRLEASLSIQLLSIPGAPATEELLGLQKAVPLDGADPQLDVIYLPALWRNPSPVLAACAELYPWLKRHSNQGAAIAATGTGVSLLAETGLLDHQPATTHWHNFARFEQRYPLVQLKRDYFVTQAGTLYCAASINSLADVTVHLIERFYSRDVAYHVQKNFSHEIRRTFEDQRYLAGGENSSDELVCEAQTWMHANVDSNITLADMAKRLGTTTRTLHRRFK